MSDGCENMVVFKLSVNSSLCGLVGHVSSIGNIPNLCRKAQFFPVVRTGVAAVSVAESSSEELDELEDSAEQISTGCSSSSFVLGRRTVA